MEKDLFNKVLHQYPASTAEEAQELLSLKEKFPYSQLLHVLTARASKDHGLTDQQTELQLAAVYSADRGLLKSLMSEEEDNHIKPELSDPLNRSISETDTASKKENPSISLESPNDPNDLAATVIRDVKELYDTRHAFEMMFVDNPTAILQSAAIPATSEDSADHGKTKRERIIELSKALNGQQTPEVEEVRAAKKRKESRKDLIDEIITTKNNIEPENEKQKEQLEVIENFIKTQPSISSAKEKPQVPSGDLSSIKTGEFGDNIVSETLVELLLKQGKKDKAIEVLKKLIWKFPQKKTYFAAQIEELKK